MNPELQAARRQMAEQFAALEAIILRRKDEPGFRKRALEAFRQWERDTGSSLPALHQADAQPEAAPEPAPAVDLHLDAYVAKAARIFSDLDWDTPAEAVARAEAFSPAYVEHMLHFPAELYPRWCEYVRAFAGQAN